jgi:hypothetical protein
MFPKAADLHDIVESDSHTLLSHKENEILTLGLNEETLKDEPST